jgi:GTP-binding protein
MKPFQSGRFFTSALTTEELPTQKFPEMAIVGRSNVGKSSLINALFQNKTLAKTSSTPGKTQRINFFLADERYFLVDLPGYGYSKAPKEAVRLWSQAIDHYLNSRKLKRILLLIDIRRDLTQEDHDFFQWASSQQIPLLVIFTKRDKLSATEAPVREACLKQQLPEGMDSMTFSSRVLDDRKRLIQRLSWD